MPSPRLAAFLSDFTLGFSDGLTVPFALTAGLSSLGRTDTVIYAGIAELCAGCISMGIGGYLSARDAARAEKETNLEGSDEERRMLETPRDSEDDEEMEEKVCPRRQAAALQRRLIDLGLPDETVLAVLEAVDSESQPLYDDASTEEHQQQRIANDKRSFAAVISGLSISLGYIIGGLLPLLPYCFAGQVGDGLKWSIVVCLVALFAYGALKDWVLGGSRPNPWRSFREGLQMALLGSLAAGAAVLCVFLVNQRESEA